MRTPVTKYTAFQALAHYYKEQYGVKLTKTSGIKILHVDETGLIEYSTVNGDVRYVRACVERTYIVSAVDSEETAGTVTADLEEAK